MCCCDTCRLYDFMGDLLDVEIGIANMANVLAEVFTGGPELCLKVREDQVASVFSLIAQDLPEGRPELLHALQAMSKVTRCYVVSDQSVSCNTYSTYKGGKVGPSFEEKPSIYCHPLFKDKRKILWSHSRRWRGKK